MNGRITNGKDTEQLARENAENIPAPAMPPLPTDQSNMPV